MPENYSVLDQLLQECCLELMASYGLTAKLQPSVASRPPANDVAVAAIDFTGQVLRGTIALRVTRSVVSETYRSALGVAAEPTAEEGADWICELVNQLIGRLKNKLRRYEVSFEVSTPRLLAAFSAAGARLLCSRFSCDTGSFAGYLDVILAPGVALVAVTPTAPLAEEGDLVLF